MSITSWVKEKASSAGEALGDVGDRLGDGLGDELRGIPQGIGSAFDNLLTVNIKTDLKEQLEPLIEQAFSKLESLLKEIASVATDLLSKSKKMAEDLIRQVLKGLSGLLSEVEQRVSNLLSQAQSLANRLIEKIKTDLLGELFEKVDSLRKALVNDLKELIQFAEEKGEKLLYKGDQIVTGTITSLKDDIEKVAKDAEEAMDIWKWFDPNVIKAKKQEDDREDFCKNRIEALGIAFSKLGAAQFYAYRQCLTLKRLNDAIELSGGKVTIKNIKLIYADLNHQAWKLACVGRAEGASLQDVALRDWIKFGQLFKLWNQFEDDNMELLDAINQKMTQLQSEIATFRSKSTDIEALLQGKRVCAGQTPKGNTNWQPHDGTTISIKVDTSQYGFKSTPIYIVNLHGKTRHSMTTGGSSPYVSTEKGFDIYVSYSDGRAITPKQANEDEWHIQWIAIGD